jgi:hypothetical protein
MPFHGAVQIISRSSTMHGLERRLVGPAFEDNK